jgi:hypothetical protein
MRERGRYQIQLIKTRSSGGVGSKIDLAFDVDRLRITDLDDDDQGYDALPSSESALATIKKRTATVQDSNNSNTVVAEKTEFSKGLRDIIKSQSQVFDDTE